MRLNSTVRRGVLSCCATLVVGGVALIPATSAPANESGADNPRLARWETRGSVSDAHAASRTARPTDTRGSVIGINGELSHALIDSAADDLGIRWLRTTVEWSFHTTLQQYEREVAGAGAGVWPHLGSFRDQSAYAHARGRRVLAIAMAAPPWARGADRRDGGYPWHQAILPRFRLAFAEYAKQLCLAGADAIEVINEPNLAREYAFGPEHPRRDHPTERVDDYVLLLRSVYDHIKADARTASCLVGIGAPAPVGHELSNDPAFIHPTVWYRQLFHATADDRKTPVSARGKFDFAAVHPYAEFGQQRGPTDWGYRWPAHLLQYGDAAYAHGMALVSRIRAELVAAGEAGKSLWATEVGAPTYGGSCRTRPCVSEARQAQWVRDYLRAWLTGERTGWHAPLPSHYYGEFTGPIFFYEWRDKSDGHAAPTDKEGFFGLLRFDGTKKPAFAVLKAQAALPRP